MKISDEGVAVPVQAVCQAAYTLEAQLIGFPQLPPLIETAEDLQRSTDRFLVYQTEGTTVGAVSFYSIAEVVVITRLVVLPGWLRRGIGTALLRALEGKVSAAAPLLVTTAQANTPAVRFYERNGFVTREVTTAPEGLVLVHMTKEPPQC